MRETWHRPAAIEKFFADHSRRVEDACALELIHTSSILDVVGEEEKLGKETGSDATSAKVTFPSVFGLARSRELAAEATRRGVLATEPLGERGRRLRELAEFLQNREQ